jgi:hypothetical protein
MELRGFLHIFPIGLSSFAQWRHAAGLRWTAGASHVQADHEGDGKSG